jgi:hypothetical protein
MRLRSTRNLLKLVMVTGLSCASLVAQEPAHTTDLNQIVTALELAQSHVRPQTAYQIIRQYRLFGGKNAVADSEVVAEVDFNPPSSKNYRIQKSSGSNRGQQVVRKVLDHEVQGGDQSRAAITRDNYDFTYIGEATLDQHACYLLGLKPKRKEKDLISGQAWVDQQSYFVRRVEGETAKTPSWWLKRVWITLAFAEFEGTWLQTSMQAVADVRMFGSHTLSSRLLDYRGAPVLASGVAQSRWHSIRSR